MRADFYVYGLFKSIGVPFYIGKGSGDRCYRHLRGPSRHGRNSYLNNVTSKMKSLGQEIIVVILRDGLTEQQAFETEIALIAAIGRHPRGPLVTRTAGGEGPSDPSQITRQLRSKALKGRKFSEATLAKMRESGKTKLFTDEHRRQLKEAAQRRVLSDEVRDSYRTAGTVWKGRKHSDEARRKMSAAKRGLTLTPEHRAKIAASLKKFHDTGV